MKFRWQHLFMLILISISLSCVTNSFPLSSIETLDPEARYVFALFDEEMVQDDFWGSEYSLQLYAGTATDQLRVQFLVEALRIGDQVLGIYEVQSETINVDKFLLPYVRSSVDRITTHSPGGSSTESRVNVGVSYVAIMIPGKARFQDFPLEPGKVTFIGNFKIDKNGSMEGETLLVVDPQYRMIGVIDIEQFFEFEEAKNTLLEEYPFLVTSIVNPFEEN